MIRKAIFTDIKKIVDLEETTIGSSLGFEMLKSYLDNPLAVILVDEEETLISYISIVFDGEIVEILNICVNPQFQGQGYGKKLLSYVENLFYSLKAKSIFLEVNENNNKAISLYKIFGFKKINTRKNYYGNDSAYVLEYKYTSQELIERKYLEVFTKIEVQETKVRFFDEKNPDKFFHNFTYLKEYNSLVIEEEIAHAKKQKLERFIFAVPDEVYLPEYKIDYLRLMHQSIHSFFPKINNHKVIFLNEEYRQRYYEMLYSDSIMYGIEYSKRNALAHINACLEDKKIVILLAIDEQEKIVGSIDLFCYQNCCKLEDFYVHENYQKQGYGYALLAFAKKYLLCQNITDLYLICNDKDVYKNMYQKMGFSIENNYCLCRKEFKDGKNECN